MDADQPMRSLQFMPILLLSVAIGVQALFLAKEKGRNVVLWTVLGFLPFINFFCICYFVGAANLKQDRKLDEILRRLQGNA